MHSGQLTEYIDILRQEEPSSEFGANRAARFATVCRTRALVDRLYPGVADDTGEVFQQMTATFTCHFYVSKTVRPYDHISTTRGRWRITGVDTDHAQTKTIIRAELLNT